MVKQAIAFGIHGSTYSSDWEILSITSEKTGWRGMVYARDEGGTATHAKPGDVHGRFKTIEEAETARTAIRQLHRDHAPAIEAAERELMRLNQLRKSAIEKALANARVTTPATPTD